MSGFGFDIDKTGFRGELQYKIFLDRYAAKDIGKSVQPGDLVIQLVDPIKGQRELARVVNVKGDTVRIHYLSGFLTENGVGTSLVGVEKEIPLESIDKPLELTSDDLADRVSKALAKASQEQNYPQGWAYESAVDRGLLTGSGSLKEQQQLAEELLYKDIIASWQFVPAGRILSGAGVDHCLTLFNCYVIASPRDSRRGINTTLGLMTEIMSRGGGVGINISSLRYRGAYVKGVNGRSSGAVSWGEEYSRRTGKVEQGGCFGPEERIFTNKGLIQAKELYERMGTGEEFYVTTHQGLKKITARFNNGIKQLYEVETERGYTTRVTLDHKMAYLDGAEVKTKPLSQFEVGQDLLLSLSKGACTASDYVKLKPADYEAHPTANQEITFPEVLNEDLGYFLGFACGNGYVHPKHKAEHIKTGFTFITNGDYVAVQERLKYLSVKLFNKTMVIDDRRLYEKDPENSVELWLSSVIVMEWFRDNNILKEKSAFIRVPEAIFKSPVSVIRQFLAGYYDADGCNRSNKCGYCYDSTSRGMLQDVQKLLLTLGIFGRLGVQDRTEVGWKDLNRLSVTGCTQKALFAYTIPANRSINREHNGKRDESVFPSSAYKALGFPGKYFAGIWDGRSSAISRAALTKIANKLDGLSLISEASQIRSLLEFHPDPIKSIKPVETLSEVYDFEVEDAHLLSTGIYSSNSRRGALMVMLCDWHPDLMEFLNCKLDGSFATNCNISVAWSDDFMAKVMKLKETGEDSDWELKFPDFTDPTYDSTWTGILEHWVADGKPVKTVNTLKVSEIWNKYVGNNWEAAEPGSLFITRVNYWSNSQYYRQGYLQCTNPCGEQPIPSGLELESGSVCNLGHINLSKFGPMGFTKPTSKDVEHQVVDVCSYVNWEELEHTVYTAVHFMDNIYNSTQPINIDIATQSFGERRVGLGTLGLAELLIRLGVTYGDNPLCLLFLDELYFKIAFWAYKTSVELAKERGAFPFCEPEKHAELPFIKELQKGIDARGINYDLVGEIRKHGIRNVTLITQAPTGSVGSLNATSTGIEPYPFLAWVRKSRIGEYKEFALVAQEYYKSTGLDPQKDKLPSFFVTAADPETAISPKDHSATQSVIQRWTDSSISKTCNLPQEFTQEDVSDFYISLYKSGAKGGTIYRDKSRSEQVLMSTNDSRVTKMDTDSPVITVVDDEEDRLDTIPILNVPNIPARLASEPMPLYREAESELGRNAWTTHLETPVGRLFVNISFLDGEPFELFVFVGKGGSEVYANCEAIGRLCSMFLQVNSYAKPSNKLIKLRDHLRNIGGSDQIGFGPKKVRSLPDGIGRALDIFLQQYPEGRLELSISAENLKETVPAPAQKNLSKSGRVLRDICPQCGSAALEHSAGCTACNACGFSKC